MKRFIPARAGNRGPQHRHPRHPAVHPRACGEQPPSGSRRHNARGSSPRVRGTAAGRLGLCRSARFIPARAGNSKVSSRTCSFSSVHPRACGEQHFAIAVVFLDCGSSPRVRGTADRRVKLVLGHRFIPARAGNRSTAQAAMSSRAVHPRACGEQHAVQFARIDETGSSPRVRGTAACRGRRVGTIRFIPARAGNRTGPLPMRKDRTVHPRACGEQMPGSTRPPQTAGSSPRVRGTVVGTEVLAAVRRFIPARAGNSPAKNIGWPSIAVHPRACGEQACRRVDGSTQPGSSPRVRGTDPLPGRSRPLSRFIPARAGNSRWTAHKSRGTAVHPRACGEQSSPNRGFPASSGSSPRVRGTAVLGDDIQLAARFIPARAGNSATAEAADKGSAVHPRACGEQSLDRT